jgi:hypothetical protein
MVILKCDFCPEEIKNDRYVRVIDETGNSGHTHILCSECGQSIISSLNVLDAYKLVNRYGG